MSNVQRVQRVWLVIFLDKNRKKPKLEKMLDTKSLHAHKENFICLLYNFGRYLVSYSHHTQTETHTHTRTRALNVLLFYLCSSKHNKSGRLSVGLVGRSVDGVSVCVCVCAKTATFSREFWL